MRFYSIKETTIYLVEGETSDLAMMNFMEHGPKCRTIQHAQSSAGCTGEYVEADDLFAALVKYQHRDK